MKNKFYKIGFCTVLVILLIVLLFITLPSIIKEESEKSLEGKGEFEFIDIYEEEVEGQMISTLEMESQGRDRFYEILVGLQTLIQTYETSDLYTVIIYQGEDFCSYSIEGNLYRKYDSASIDDWYKSSLEVHYEVKKNEVCE